ncbi:MAG: pyridoxamine 5'-phosphate oxidase [Candidatus Eremiobacteraeota bacterium]|nr:pyridoxamine 5'-phosphate oxidase [Candidatus Eremiobacteraeota bacterium]MBC5803548.1 pyridoxamine 5'-phosphate oxidase [Candidatus Eremiobacteraeota bacterium]MBC5820411.1 pyridoxamine 5'-phosphate oxidase [Candidatus Eremiobacteraeota bacterium]
MRAARITYQKGALTEADVAPDPLAQFHVWLEEALADPDLREPYAMTLATVGDEAQPAARIVLLRGYDQRGFVFFTNYDSRKGRELAGHPRAALLFYWPSLERQIRIDGSVERLPAFESDAYFALRPRGHRVNAWASKQSSVVPDRAFLEAQMAQEDRRFRDVDVPRPPYWGGYRVEPHAFEFWQGRPNRLHDRIAYVHDGAWHVKRLSP